MLSALRPGILALWHERISGGMPISCGRYIAELAEAWPGSGFWVAVVGGVAVVAAVWLRSRVCRVCPGAEQCGATCPHHLVRPPALP